MTAAVPVPSNGTITSLPTRGSRRRIGQRGVRRLSTSTDRRSCGARVRLGDSIGDGSIGQENQDHRRRNRQGDQRGDQHGHHIGLSQWLEERTRQTLHEEDRQQRRHFDQRGDRRSRRALRPRPSRTMFAVG